MARPSRKNQWFIKATVERSRDATRMRVHRAAIFVRDEIKKSLNVSNTHGDNPSQEGEPPHKVSADLQRSIIEDVADEKDSVVGRVGSSSVYAPRLEFGFRGTDSLGRSIAQGPRPFMRPGLFNNLEKVRAILGAKK